MPIETGTTISELDNTWPLGGDPILEGDDHLRLIKRILKLQFPGEAGDGFAAAITATEAEINYLGGAESNIQNQIDAILSDTKLVAPPGTTMVFYQQSPPAGWVQDVSVDDSMLRAVELNGGGSGGTDSPITFDVTHTHTTDFFTLTEDHLPTHTHDTIFYYQGNNKASEGQSYCTEQEIGQGDFEGLESRTSESAGQGNPHNHGDTDEFQATFTPKYINVIVAVKT